MNNKKTGFVSLIGRPSAGKSTLINAICGYKISIVSKHPQTTRFLVRGIFTDDESQMIFIDTPGYHNFNSLLNKGLSNLAVRNLEDGDLILYVVDVTREFGQEEEEIIERIKPYKDKIIGVFNKCDLVERKNSEQMEEIKSRLPGVDFLEISAAQNYEVDSLLNRLKESLEEGPLYYPEEYVTDQAIPFRIQEVVREKIFHLTKEEVPHSVYISIDNLETSEHKITAHAVINVEKESQKGILIGKKGATIKKIGIESRNDLKDIFECDVELFLKVKVHHNWKKNENFVKNMFKLG